MKKISFSTLILLTIMVLVIGILIGYLVTTKINNVQIEEKVSIEQGKNENTKKNNVNSQIDTSNYEYNAEVIAKEKIPIAISFANQEHSGYAYSGGFDWNDYITVDTDKDYLKISMYASSKFNTLNSLKEHLKNSLSEELINKYFKTEKNNYLEKDGKLYCADGKPDAEGLLTVDEDAINEKNSIKYTISNKKSNSFDVKVEAKYGLMGSYERDQLVTINATITKIDNNWKVTKYVQN